MLLPALGLSTEGFLPLAATAVVTGVADVLPTIPSCLADCPFTYTYGSGWLALSASLVATLLLDPAN